MGNRIKASGDQYKKIGSAWWRIPQEPNSGSYEIATGRESHLLDLISSILNEIKKALV